AVAHTVLVEPWLVLFCLAEAVAVMDRDRLATGRRLAVNDVAFGFANAGEGGTIVPVIVVFVLCLTDPMSGGSRPRRAAPFVDEVAAAFCLPVLPFALGAPRGFYQSLVVAQVGPRTGAVHIPLSERLYDMTGLTGIYAPVHVNLFFTQF